VPREVQITAAVSIGVSPNEHPIAITRTGEIATVHFQAQPGHGRHGGAGAVLKLGYGRKAQWILQSAVRWAA
jgi:hypothetical protein